MKKVISKLFTINIYDVWKGVIMFFVSNLGDLALQALMMWQQDRTIAIDWKEMFVVSGIATLSYIIKQFFTGTKQPLPEIKPETTDKITSSK